MADLRIAIRIFPIRLPGAYHNENGGETAAVYFLQVLEKAW